MADDLKPETKAIHVPTRRGGDMAPAIHLASTYEHGPAYEPIHEFTYARGDTPNLVDLEARLSALEGGCGAVAYASGMAAASGLLASLEPGSRVIFHRDLYFTVRKLTETHFPRWGLTHAFVD